MIDDRISPDINQGLTGEVLRIRNREIAGKNAPVWHKLEKDTKFLLDDDG